MSSASNILVIENLRKEFKRVTALKGIDIVLEKPRVYGFLGPNGAGKTTTFRLICALLRPTSGRILVGGIDVWSDTPTAMSKIGVQFDSPGFYPYLTGRENLNVVARWLGGTPGRKRIDELLALVGLANAANRKVGSYSWGMRQRLGLASALISNPMLVLLDEPTNGLDPAGIADIRRLLPSLAHDQGRAVFVSSHRMEEVEHVCDHVTIIHEGTIAAAGTPDELTVREDTIEIRCDDPGAAAGCLRSIGGIEDVHITGRTALHVRAPDLLASQVNELLVSRGIAVEHVVRRRESLEQVFFRLTSTGAVSSETFGVEAGRPRVVPGGMDGSVSDERSVERRITRDDAAERRQKGDGAS